GAVGVGAVGAFSSKLKSATAGIATARHGGQSVQEVHIPVLLVRGGRRDFELLVPRASASPGDTVIWGAITNTECLDYTEVALIFRPVMHIIGVSFKDAPSRDREASGDYENPIRGSFSWPVPGDAPIGRYTYSIRVVDDADNEYVLDPPLDIVPGA
ncbi:MAG: hypothetical protein P8Y11_07115, partial [Gemmatimonadales bacterium]